MAASPKQALLLSFWRRHRRDETMAVYSLAVTDLRTIIYLLCLVVFLLSKERCFKTAESRVQMNPYPHVAIYIYILLGHPVDLVMEQVLVVLSYYSAHKHLRANN